MNCRQCQKRILGAFAAAEAVPPDAVVEHKQNCGACQAYYELQASFFRRLEEGLKVMANEEVPPSLVPRLKARLTSELPSASAWAPVCGMAAVAAAVLAVSLGSAFLDRPKYRGAVSERAKVATHSMESPVVATREPPGAAKPSLGRPPKPTRAHASGQGAEVSEVMPEVIVLPEERAAFARFVAESPGNQEVALASTRAAPPNDEVSAEIVALEIEGLELESLDPGWE
jgi:hypothetical protein